MTAGAYGPTKIGRPGPGRDPDGYLVRAMKIMGRMDAMGTKSPECWNIT